MTVACRNGDGIGDADRLHEGGFVGDSVVAEPTAVIVATGEDEAIGSEGDGVMATSRDGDRI